MKRHPKYAFKVGDRVVLRDSLYHFWSGVHGVVTRRWRDSDNFMFSVGGNSYGVLLDTYDNSMAFVETELEAENV